MLFWSAAADRCLFPGLGRVGNIVTGVAIVFGWESAQDVCEDVLFCVPLQVFGWPMPMYISGSVMGKTAFSLWIGLACLWAVVAACVITFLAPFEAFQSKGRSQQTLPPVQLQPVELEQSAQNPLSNPTATWQEGRESPLAPDGDATSANIPAAAVDFIRDRRQQQHADSPGLGAFVAEEAEL